MKLSFSTVGCPQWTWSEILSAASDLGYDGLEIRGLGDDLYLPDNKFFKPERLEQTAKDLAARKIGLACLASDIFLQDASIDAVSALRAYIKLAAALKARCIRVLGDAWAEPGENVDDELVRSRLCQLAPDAQDSGVMLLVESNGVFAESARLRALLDGVGSASVAALWDVNHPVRFFNERVEETYENIGRYVHHVHIKDSEFDGGKLKYKMLGYGTLPIKEALTLLKRGGYSEFLSLEWTKRWNEDLEDAGIVFGHYVYEMKKMLRSL